MFNRIKYAIKNPAALKQYYTRTKRLANFLNSSESNIESFFKQSLACWNQIEEKLRDTTGVIRMGSERLQILYACVCVLKPNIMVETGVAGGGTSLTILSAMQKNGNGKLYSIDIGNPNYVVGWMVPEELRTNWHLIIGDSKKELPELVSSLKKIDLFFHDSSHTYEHMSFEFSTVFPFLDERKIILSDDIDVNTSFDDFVKKNALVSEKFYGFGAAKSRGSTI